MTTRLTLWLALLTLMLAVAACGGATGAPSPAAAAATVKPPATMIPLAAAPTVEPKLAAPTAKAPAATSACADYFGFCITAQATGAVNATGAGGWASSSKTDCAALAAPGAARILELPNLLAAGEQPIAVALTRIGAYTGPGAYALAATANSGAMPDMFPAVRIGSRAFSNGADTTATVTVNADGSGTLAARNLVEMDAMQGATPDPNARLDFAMQWTCQGKGSGG